jgi:signal transduction histidine kinase
MKQMTSSRPSLAAAFLSILLLFTLTQAISLYRSAQIRREAQSIMDNALTSVELVMRMARDFDEERVLLMRHIFEKEAAPMANAEAELAEARRDFLESSHSYGPLAIFPGERATWDEVQEEVDAMREPIDELLTLSRANEDVAANARMKAVDGYLEKIHADMKRLVEINLNEARQAQGREGSLSEWFTSFSVTLASLGIVPAFFVGVYVTQRVHLREVQLTRHSEQLLAINRELDAFAGRVAHDLRAPLAAVSLAANLMARQGTEKLAPAATIRRGVERMNVLISELLALSQIEASACGGVSEPSGVAETVRADLAARLEETRGELALYVEPARVACPAGLLAQVLTNLVENGLKYARSDERPRVEVSGRMIGDAYELRVSDNGVGLAPDEVNRLFQPFFRADRTRAIPGTGLGLTIVKRVVDATRGTIAFQSELGRGTTVTVLLPREQ